MSLILKMKADSGSISVALDDLDKKIRKVSKRTKSFGNIVKGVLTARAITQGFSMIIRGFQSMGKSALKYQDVLQNLQGITLSTPKSMKYLNKEILALANNMEHSAVATAEAGLSVSKMGFTSAETAQVLATTMDLATASIVDSNEASTVAISTMRAFGLELEELDRVANVIQSTVSGTSIGFMDYAEAMKFVAPIADKVGVSLEEMSASIGFLGNIGLKGSIGGTALKNMLLNLLKPGEEVSNMLLRMEGEGKGLIDILMEMKSEDMDIATFLDTFNKRALAGALSLSEMGGGIKVLIKDLENQKIKVKEVAEIMRQSLSKQLSITAGKANIVSTQFLMIAASGGTLVESFKPLNEGLEELQIWMGNNEVLIREFTSSVVRLAVNLSLLGLKGFKGIIENGNTAFLILSSLAGLKFASAIASIKLFNVALLTTSKYAKMAKLSMGWLIVIETALLTGMNLYIDSVDRAIARLATLDLSKEDNVKAQIEAIEKYADVLAKYEKVSKDLPERPSMNRYDKSPSKSSERIKNQKLGDLIELEFNLPKQFLDTFSKSSDAWKRAEYLRKSLDKNTQAVEKKTVSEKDADSFLDKLKEAMEAAEKKKKKSEGKAGKKDLGSSNLSWRDKLVDDLSKTISDAFTISIPKPGSNDLRLPGVDSLEKSILSLADEFAHFELRPFDYLTKSSGKSSFNGVGINDVSPLTQVNPSFQAGEVDFAAQKIPIEFSSDKAVEEFKNKLKEEKFVIDIEFAEMKADELDELASYLKNAAIEIESIDKEIASLYAEIDAIDEKLKEFWDNLSESFSLYGGVQIDIINMVNEVSTRNYRNEQKAFDKRLSNLKKEQKNKILSHKNQKAATYLIDREYAKKEAEILKEKERREKEYRKKQHTANVMTATANAAMAVLSAIATANSNPERIAMGILFGVLGTAQVGIVASNVPEDRSRMEQVTEDRMRVDRETNIVSKVENSLVTETNPRSLNVYVENLYDDYEHTRHTIETVMNENEKY